MLCRRKAITLRLYYDEIVYYAPREEKTWTVLLLPEDIE